MGSFYQYYIVLIVNQPIDILKLNRRVSRHSDSSILHGSKQMQICQRVWAVQIDVPPSRCRDIYSPFIILGYGYIFAL